MKSIQKEVIRGGMFCLYILLLDLPLTVTIWTHTTTFKAVKLCIYIFLQNAEGIVLPWQTCWLANLLQSVSAWCSHYLESLNKDLSFNTVDCLRFQGQLPWIKSIIEKNGIEWLPRWLPGWRAHNKGSVLTPATRVWLQLMSMHLSLISTCPAHCIHHK